MRRDPLTWKRDRLSLAYPLSSNLSLRLLGQRPLRGEFLRYRTPVAHRAATTLMFAILLSASGACTREPAAETSAGEPATAVVDPLPQRLSDIRLAISEKNYGQAASDARSAQAMWPGDSRIHLLAAQAEAHLGNAGNAASAFQRAVDTGLVDPAQALTDPAFKGVRQSDPFRDLRARLIPARHSRPTSSVEAEGGERIRAGDVEILSDGSGDYVRAGDVVLDTRP